MRDFELSEREKRLLERLEGPPAKAGLSITNVWIVEWLPKGEQQTGRQLHEWLEGRRPGWSVCFPCKSKEEVIAAIRRATKRALTSGMAPILHIEAHGGDVALAGPNASGGTELLSWDELTEPLQQLNMVTKCNLVVVIAACVGIAGIQAFRKGPRAPAAALVGPGTSIAPGQLLWGTKEFYRCVIANDTSLGEMVENASREAGTAFDWEPFALLCFEAMTEQRVRSLRPAQQMQRSERLRQRLLAERGMPQSEVEEQLASLSFSNMTVELQRTWDEMFLIDIYPENRQRFGIDLSAIVAMLQANVK